MTWFETEIQRRLEDAQRPRGAEKRRLEAIDWLLAVRRVQLFEAGGAGVHRDISLFFERAANDIWSQPDPLAAMKGFLHGQRSKGRPRADGEMSFRIAVAIQKRVNAGETIDAASEQVAREAGTATSRDYAKRLYFEHRNDLAVKAEIWLAAYEAMSLEARAAYEAMSSKDKADFEMGKSSIPPRLPGEGDFNSAI